MAISQEILKNPKISVIITSYNYQQFIGEAIESVLNQTLPAYEIIVVDDNSTDNTLDFLRRKYSNIVKIIVHEKNKGQSATRNTGAYIATGNILQFLDADDLILPNKFELQIDFWRRNSDFDLIYCDFLNFRDGDLLYQIPKAKSRPQGNLLESLLLGQSLAIHTVLIPKTIFDKIGGFREDIRISSDHWFWTQCALQGYTFGYLPQILALRRLHSSNLTKNIIKQLEAGIEFHEWSLSLKLEPELIKNIHRKLAEAYTNLALEQAKNRFFVASWFSIKKSKFHRFLAARYGSRRDKAYWLVDVLIWLGGIYLGIVKKSHGT